VDVVMVDGELDAGVEEVFDAGDRIGLEVGDRAPELGDRAQREGSDQLRQLGEVAVRQPGRHAGALGDLAYRRRRQLSC
jgi:hypothetical protein